LFILPREQEIAGPDARCRRAAGKTYILIDNAAFGGYLRGKPPFSIHDFAAAESLYSWSPSENWKLPVSGFEDSNAVYLRMPAETLNMVS
jgi:hypothetical protein